MAATATAPAPGAFGAESAVVNQPGVTPRVCDDSQEGALKGRKGGTFRPFRAEIYVGSSYPGRCPRLVTSVPSARISGTDCRGETC